jgi:outer membrane immunogenic protein
LTNPTADGNVRAGKFGVRSARDAAGALIHSSNAQVGGIVKRLILAGIASAALAGTPVLAAQPLASPAFNWTGFYAGIDGGYAWQSARSVNFAGNDDLMRSIIAGTGFGDPSQTPAGLASLSLHGFAGGVFAGYNWQLAPRWLIGIEADLSATGLKDTGSTTFTLVTPQTATIGARQELPWFATIRGRLGFLATDNVLLFGTAGFAFGQVKEDATLATSQPAFISSSGGGTFVCTGGGATCFDGSSSKTVGGGAFGAGAEFLVTPQLRLKAEYLYVSLGNGNAVTVTALNGGGSAPASFNANYPRVAFSTARLGLSYMF